MDPIETPLLWYVMIMAITFGLLLLSIGIGWLLCWLGGQVVLVVLRAFNPSHPITPEEELD